MQDQKTEDYSIVFYDEGKVVSVGSITSSKDEVRNLVKMLANADSKYLPKQGKYDMVGFVKTFNLYEMADKIENETKDYKKALDEIAEAICIPGEEASDGECLDSVFSILEKIGYNIEEMLKRAEEKQKEEGK
jgi:hypothetical protein